MYETESPDALGEYASIDEFSVCKKPSRGEEVSFRVRFDPGEEPCYSAIRAGVGSDSLGLVVAAMGSVKLYRSRDVASASFGSAQTQKEFYLAVEIQGHRGLVRDVAWAPGNIRGYDIIATACGWDINPRAIGIVPKEAKVFMLDGTHWLPDAHFMAVPKGVAPEKLAAATQKLGGNFDGPIHDLGF